MFLMVLHWCILFLFTRETSFKILHIGDELQWKQMIHRSLKAGVVLVLPGESWLLRCICRLNRSNQNIEEYGWSRDSNFKYIKTNYWPLDFSSPRTWLSWGAYAGCWPWCSEKTAEEANNSTALYSCFNRQTPPQKQLGDRGWVQCHMRGLGHKGQQLPQEAELLEEKKIPMQKCHRSFFNKKSHAKVPPQLF